MTTSRWCQCDDGIGVFWTRVRFPRCVVVAVFVSSDRSLPKGRIWVTVRVRSKGEKESKGG